MTDPSSPGTTRTAANRTADTRSCTLAACHRVGLYVHIHDPNGDEFLSRQCLELVTEAGVDCPVQPPYGDILMTFRQAMHTCLLDKGYTKVRLYLQRLCSTLNGQPYTWDDFCRYHADRLG